MFVVDGWNLLEWAEFIDFLPVFNGFYPLLTNIAPLGLFILFCYVDFDGLDNLSVGTNRG